MNDAPTATEPGVVVVVEVGSGSGVSGGGRHVGSVTTVDPDSPNSTVTSWAPSERHTKVHDARPSSPVVVGLALVIRKPLPTVSVRSTPERPAPLR